MAAAPASTDKDTYTCTYAKGGADPHTHIPFVPNPPYGISNTIMDNIGHTPLVRINNITRKEGIKCNLLAKCEFFNAGGSVKDRIALRMIEDAERSGRIKPGDTLIEPTSGNTGIGLALCGAIKGYRVIITLPEKMSEEKVNVLKALGAEIIRTPTEAAWDSPESHMSVAFRLEKQLPNAHILNQYDNPGNPLAHYDGTAEELLYQTGGKIDVVVLGAGTGGTLTGIARKLKEKIPGVRVVAVDPHGSDLALPPSLNNVKGSYHVEGIGYDFIPKVLDRSLVDQWYKTGDKESFKWARRLIRDEGLLCGGSSGAAFSVALMEARTLGEGKNVVVLLADSIRNYTGKFVKMEWMKQMGLLEEEEQQAEKQSEDKWKGKTVKDLSLPVAVTAKATDTVGAVVEVLKARGFDSLPIVDDKSGLVGVVTEGQLLARTASGRISADDMVSKAMFRFSKKHRFVPITPDTPLAWLEKFFDRHQAAIVTASASDNTPTHICTKIDLLSALLQKKI